MNIQLKIVKRINNFWQCATKSATFVAMKTNPIGVRFEIKDLEFIKKRESIKTNQGVVDFLLSEYCKLYRIEKSSVFLIQDLTKPTNEIKPYEQPESNFTVNALPKEEPRALSEFEDFKNQIYKCTTIEEIENVMVGVKGALMFPKEKRVLEEIAKDHSKNFYTD